MMIVTLQGFVAMRPCHLLARNDGKEAGHHEAEDPLRSARGQAFADAPGKLATQERRRVGVATRQKPSNATP